MSDTKNEGIADLPGCSGDGYTFWGLHTLSPFISIVIKKG
jgi:hypothetical protein